MKTVLEQLDLLGGQVVPVLRREMDAIRPAHVPDGPTHQGRVDVAALADLDPDTADHDVLEGSIR